MTSHRPVSAPPAVRFSLDSHASSNEGAVTPGAFNTNNPQAFSPSVSSHRPTGPRGLASALRNPVPQPLQPSQLDVSSDRHQVLNRTTQVDESEDALFDTKLVSEINDRGGLGIIGGGITGLVAALEAAEAGVAVTVYTPQPHQSARLEPLLNFRPSQVQVLLEKGVADTLFSPVRGIPAPPDNTPETNRFQLSAVQNIWYGHLVSSLSATCRQKGVHFVDQKVSADNVFDLAAAKGLLIMASGGSKDTKDILNILGVESKQDADFIREGVGVGEQTYVSALIRVPHVRHAAPGQMRTEPDQRNAGAAIVAIQQQDTHEDDLIWLNVQIRSNETRPHQIERALRSAVQAEYGRLSTDENYIIEKQIGPYKIKPRQILNSADGAPHITVEVNGEERSTPVLIMGDAAGSSGFRRSAGAGTGIEQVNKVLGPALEVGSDPWSLEEETLSFSEIIGRIQQHCLSITDERLAAEGVVFGGDQRQVLDQNGAEFPDLEPKTLRLLALGELKYRPDVVLPKPAQLALMQGSDPRPEFQQLVSQVRAVQRENDRKTLEAINVLGLKVLDDFRLYGRADKADTDVFLSLQTHPSVDVRALVAEIIPKALANGVDEPDFYVAALYQLQQEDPNEGIKQSVNDHIKKLSGLSLAHPYIEGAGSAISTTYSQSAVSDIDRTVSKDRLLARMRDEGDAHGWVARLSGYGADEPSASIKISKAGDAVRVSLPGKSDLINMVGQARYQDAIDFDRVPDALKGATLLPSERINFSRYGGDDLFFMSPLTQRLETILLNEGHSTWESGLDRGLYLDDAINSPVPIERPVRPASESESVDGETEIEQRVSLGPNTVVGKQRILQKIRELDLEGVGQSHGLTAHIDGKHNRGYGGVSIKISVRGDAVSIYMPGLPNREALIAEGKYQEAIDYRRVPNELRDVALRPASKMNYNSYSGDTLFFVTPLTARLEALLLAHGRTTLEAGLDQGIFLEGSLEVDWQSTDSFPAFEVPRDRPGRFGGFVSDYDF